MSIFDGVAPLSWRPPAYGDVIAAARLSAYGRDGFYNHYGIYKSDCCVYEYAGAAGDSGDICVRISTLEKFIGNSGRCFVVPFPETYEAFARSKRRGMRPEPSAAPEAELPRWLEDLQRAAESLQEEARASAYRLYSPEETIRRAHSRLGERKYSLPFNNCEHYAVWCKTGLSDSRQVDAVLNALAPILRPLEAAALDRLCAFLRRQPGAEDRAFPGGDLRDWAAAAAEAFRTRSS